MARLIDADALMKEHCDRCSLDLQESCKADPVCASMMWIVEAPTVDAVPVVHGRWEKKTNDYVYFYACSECGGPVLRGQWGNDFFSSYCPNCGAYMRERKDNEYD